MSNSILDQAFEKHAQDYLCSESYDFPKEVSINTEPVNNWQIKNHPVIPSLFRFILASSVK